MASIASLSLDQFNQRVLACQDEAFALAYSILGDEGLSCEVVQAVFLRIYTQLGDGGHPIPVKVLQGVIGMCRQAKPSKADAGLELIPGWHLLECDEQEASLLVDMLGKSYQQAAYVLDKSDHEVAATVAMGRYKLIRSSRSESERDPERKKNKKEAESLKSSIHNWLKRQGVNWPK